MGAAESAPRRRDAAPPQAAARRFVATAAADFSTAYVLALEDGCFYVGLTRGLASSLAAHWAGRGEAWTALHRPLSVDTVVPDATPADASRILTRYLRWHGIDRVRGGPYSAVTLTAEQTAELDNALRAAADDPPAAADDPPPVDLSAADHPQGPEVLDRMAPLLDAVRRPHYSLDGRNRKPGAVAAPPSV